MYYLGYLGSGNFYVNELAGSTRRWSK